MSETPRTDDFFCNPPENLEAYEFCARLELENIKLKEQLAFARETIESVCIGEKLECPKCGKPRPCCCQDLH